MWKSETFLNHSNNVLQISPLNWASFLLFTIFKNFRRGHCSNSILSCRVFQCIDIYVHECHLVRSVLMSKFIDFGAYFLARRTPSGWENSVNQFTFILRKYLFELLVWFGINHFGLDHWWLVKLRFLEQSIHFFIDATVAFENDEWLRAWVVFKEPDAPQKWRLAIFAE